MNLVVGQKRNQKQKHQFPCRSKVERINASSINHLNVFNENHGLFTGSRRKQKEAAHTFTSDCGVVVQRRSWARFESAILRGSKSMQLWRRCTREEGDMWFLGCEELGYLSRNAQHVRRSFRTCFPHSWHSAPTQALDEADDAGLTPAHRCPVHRGEGRYGIQGCPESRL